MHCYVFRIPTVYHSDPTIETHSSSTPVRLDRRNSLRQSRKGVEVLFSS